MEPTTKVTDVTNILDIPNVNCRCKGVYSEDEKAKVLAKFPHAGDVYFNTKTSTLYIPSAPARILDVVPCAEWQAKGLAVEVDPTVIRECAAVLATLSEPCTGLSQRPLIHFIADNWLFRVQWHEGQGLTATLILTAPPHPAQGGWFEFSLGEKI